MRVHGVLHYDRECFCHGCDGCERWTFLVHAANGKHVPVAAGGCPWTHGGSTPVLGVLHSRSKLLPRLHRFAASPLCSALLCSAVPQQSPNHISLAIASKRTIDALTACRAAHTAAAIEGAATAQCCTVRACC